MFFKIVIGQAKHKWGITLLVFLALTSVVTLYIYLKNTTSFANRSMQLIMKNMGHNLLILPDEADPYNTYLCTDRQLLFPDTSTVELAKHVHLASRYYVSLLQQSIAIGENRFILSGIEPVPRKDETREKGNLIKPLKEGTCRLGAAASANLGLDRGSMLELMGQQFEIKEILPSKGTEDDYRIYINLKDCQSLLNHPGQINVILSFACLHVGNLEETEAFQKRELPKFLPGFKQITKTDIFQGRYFARLTTQKSLYYILALVFGITVLLIVVTGLQEVSERAREVGILVSMGANYFTIVGLYFTKILLLALVASVVGFLIGSALSVQLNASYLTFNTAQIRIVWSNLPSVVWLTCAVALLSEIPPMVKLLCMDPTATLVEE